MTSIRRALVRAVRIARTDPSSNGEVGYSELLRAVAALTEQEVGVREYGAVKALHEAGLRAGGLAHYQGAISSLPREKVRIHVDIQYLPGLKRTEADLNTLLRWLLFQAEAKAVMQELGVNPRELIQLLVASE